jgi:hypothetical protein
MEEIEKINICNNKYIINHTNIYSMNNILNMPNLKLKYIWMRDIGVREPK